MIKLKELLTEDYIVTIEDRKGKLIQRGNFTLKSDANLYIKDIDDNIVTSIQYHPFNLS